MEFSSDYRFGFNGQEKDNEIKGIGNSLDFGARIYDSRLGKWLSLDPMADLYPSESDYSFSLNNPIKNIDVGGQFVTDKEGNVIVTFKRTRREGVDFNKDNSDYVMPGPEKTRMKNGKAEVYRESKVLRGIWGSVLTNKGTEIRVFIPTVKEVRTFVELKDSETGKFGNGYYKEGSEQRGPELEYNCVTNSLTKIRTFIIPANDITNKILGEEGYTKLEQGEMPEKGDIGVYQADGVGYPEHFEVYLSSDKVSTKGGYAKDYGPVPPKYSPFIQNRKYSVMRKRIKDTKTNNSFVRPLRRSQRNQGYNAVLQSTFDSIKKEVVEKENKKE